MVDFPRAPAAYAQPWPRPASPRQAPRISPAAVAALPAWRTRHQNPSIPQPQGAFAPNLGQPAPQVRHSQPAHPQADPRHPAVERLGGLREFGRGLMAMPYPVRAQALAAAGPLLAAYGYPREAVAGLDPTDETLGQLLAALDQAHGALMGAGAWR